MKKLLLVLSLFLPVMFYCSGCDQTKTNQKYSVTVTTNMNEHCTIYGDGDYYEGAKFTIVVIPDEGYEFVQWSDGNTNNVREKTKASRNETFTATIKKSTKKYALNKVELWAEQYKTFTTKCVEFYSLTIREPGFSGKTISECKLNNGYSTTNGSYIIGYDSTSDKVVINATQQNPYLFYSSRIEQNCFVENETKTIQFNLGIICHTGYLNDGVWVKGSSCPVGTQIKDVDITVQSSSLTKTAEIYKSDCGYKIMAKLYFNEI